MERALLPDAFIYIYAYIHTHIYIYIYQMKYALLPHAHAFASRRGPPRLKSSKSCLHSVKRAQKRPVFCQKKRKRPTLDVFACKRGLPHKRKRTWSRPLLEDVGLFLQNMGLFWDRSSNRGLYQMCLRDSQHGERSKRGLPRKTKTHLVQASFRDCRALLTECRPLLGYILQ